MDNLATMQIMPKASDAALTRLLEADWNALTASEIIIMCRVVQELWVAEGSAERYTDEAGNTCYRVLHAS